MAQHESYEGLARKWRPMRFEDLVGQESVTQALQNALRQGRVVHAHILTGPRGVGKTTSARILAKALCCETGPTPTPCCQCVHCKQIAIGSHMDVIEIDAASNTGVDNIRELRERVIQAPFSARYKVYIIDEVHMLSTGAFNALLKTLEEPPPNVVFIFATTEIEKVPETIRSRCVVHNFRRMSTEDIIRRLSQVGQGEGVDVETPGAKESFALIARTVEGGMRDAMVALDQLLALTDGKPTPEAAVGLLGLADQRTLTDAVQWMAEGQGAQLLKLIDELIERGRSLERFVKTLIAYLRDLMLLQAGGSAELIKLTGDALEAARGQVKTVPPAKLYNILNQMFELEERLKRSSQARFLVEFTFLRLANVQPVVPLDDILRRVQALPEAALQATAAPQTASPAALSQPPQTPNSPPANPARRVAQAAGLNPMPTAMTSSVAPSPATPALIMHDSAAQAPATATPSREGAFGAIDATAGQSLAGLDRDQILKQLEGQLPDNTRYLMRHLKKTVDLKVEGEALVAVWPEDAGLAMRLVDRADNVQVIEETVRQITGQTIKYRAQATAGSAQTPPVPSQAPSPAQAAPQAPRLTQAAVPPTPAQPAPGQSQTPRADSFSYDDEPPVEDLDGDYYEAGDASPVAAAPAATVASPAVPPRDTRSPLQKAKSLMESNDEISRRIKMLREMFNGQAIDDQGQPLGV